MIAFKLLAATAALPAAVNGAGTATAHSPAPTIKSEHTTRSASHARAGTASAPRSAYGCNQEVCISVVGNGTYVKTWATSAYPSYAYRCTWANYWANGKLLYSGSLQCRSDYYYYDSVGIYGNVKAGSQVCNTWYGIPGKPCESIH
jgi:hypothetical protein